jgi:hypothetical protein
LLEINQGLSSIYSLKRHAESAIAFARNKENINPSVWARLLIKVWNGRIVTW